MAFILVLLFSDEGDLVYIRLRLAVSLFEYLSICIPSIKPQCLRKSTQNAQNSPTRERGKQRDINTGNKMNLKAKQKTVLDSLWKLHSFIT